MQRGKIIASGVLNETDMEISDGGLLNPEEQEAKPRTYEYKWLNIVLMLLIHLQAMYGVYLLFFGRAKWPTLIFGMHN